MSIQLVKREKLGASASKDYKKQGLVPVIVYSKNKESDCYLVTLKDLQALFEDYTVRTKYSEFKTPEGKSVKLLIKDIDYDPITDRPIHVDFMKVSKGDVALVPCPIKFINHDKSPGVKRGGEVSVAKYDIPLSCPITDQPLEVTVDLEGSSIGDKFYTQNIQLPKNASFKHNHMVAKLVGKRVKDDKNAAGSAASEDESAEESK